MTHKDFSAQLCDLQTICYSDGKISTEVEQYASVTLGIVRIYLGDLSHARKDVDTLEAILRWFIE